MYGQRQTAYRDTEVLSSTPERLVPLMYERLLVSLKRGTMHMRDGDVEGKFECLQRSQDLLTELLGSLDFEKGGDIARHLSSLYSFWSREISAAGRAQDAQRLTRVIGMVAELHESWVEAVRVLDGEAAPVAAAGGSS
jgi:flagellar protein FliS